jgi:amidohydrolase
MLDEGLLDTPRPDAAFAIHITPNLPAGLVGSRTGPVLASANEFEIVVRGTGGHGSMPHQAIDPTLVACEIAVALQTFVTRRINAFDPAVVTVASISGGTTFNVIPETVRLLGTLRAVSEAAQKAVQDGVRRGAVNVARAHECVAEVEIRPGFPATINDARAVALVEAAVRAELGPTAYLPMPTPAMGSVPLIPLRGKV